MVVATFRLRDCTWRCALCDYPTRASRPIFTANSPEERASQAKRHFPSHFPSGRLPQGSVLIGGPNEDGTTFITYGSGDYLRDHGEEHGFFEVT